MNTLKRLFLTGAGIAIAALAISGCAAVQWLPSSSCEHVKYERHGDKVDVEAQCRL